MTLRQIGATLALRCGHAGPRGAPMKVRLSLLGLLWLLGCSAPLPGRVQLDATDSVAAQQDAATEADVDAVTQADLEKDVYMSDVGAQAADAEVAGAAGNIVVKMLFDNQVPVANVIVRVQVPPFACRSFDPVKPPDSSLKTVTIGLADPLQVGDLPANQPYAIVALGENASGHLVAAACADTIQVFDHMTTEITLDLYTLPLQASGTYNLVSGLDFKAAIPTQADQILDAAVQLFDDPGPAVIAGIEAGVQQAKPGIATDAATSAAYASFAKQVANVVSDGLLNNSPTWLQAFLTIGQDVLQICKTVDLLGVLQIANVAKDFTFQGDLTVTGIDVYWKAGCDKTAPDYADCGKLAFDMAKALTDPDFPLESPTAKVAGTPSQQTHLALESEPIHLNCGKLVAYVMLQIVVKKVTGEQTFLGALHKLVNCPGIVSGLDATVLGQLGLSAGDLQGICEDALAKMVAPLDKQLADLKAASTISLTGTCTMLDADGDLKVDKLIDGQWTGKVVKGAIDKPFAGTFVATP